jgi:hypothetical protein
VAALPIASVIGLSALAWTSLAKESSYRQRFSGDWKARFEEEQGSLATARIKIGAEILGVVANAGLGTWLYRILIPALRGQGYASCSPGRSKRKRKRKRSFPSSTPKVSQTTTAPTIAPSSRELSAPPRIQR